MFNFMDSRDGGVILWLSIMVGPGFTRSQSMHWRMILLASRISCTRTR